MIFGPAPQVPGVSPGRQIYILRCPQISDRLFRRKKIRGGCFYRTQQGATSFSLTGFEDGDVYARVQRSARGKTLHALDVLRPKPDLVEALTRGSRMERRHLQSGDDCRTRSTRGKNRRSARKSPRLTR